MATLFRFIRKNPQTIITGPLLLGAVGMAGSMFYNFFFVRMMKEGKVDMDVMLQEIEEMDDTELNTHYIDVEAHLKRQRELKKSSKSSS